MTMRLVRLRWAQGDSSSAGSVSAVPASIRIMKRSDDLLAGLDDIDWAALGPCPLRGEDPERYAGYVSRHRAEHQPQEDGLRGEIA